MQIYQKEFQANDVISKTFESCKICSTETALVDNGISCVKIPVMLSFNIFSKCCIKNKKFLVSCGQIDALLSLVLVVVKSMGIYQLPL